MLNSLQKLMKLPTNTAVYCAHEYTMANLAFATMVEPDNHDLSERIRADQAKRDKNHATVPSSLSLELATNPFLRFDQQAVINSAASRGADTTEAVSVFGTIRAWKDIA